MLTWIAQTTIISIILIYLVHHLLNFFKSTLTVPKLKDLVNSPTQKYENMYNIISNKNNNTSTLNEISKISNDYTSIDLLPKPEIIMSNELLKEGSESMKNELKNFLKKQLNTHDNINNNDSRIVSLDTFKETSKYSFY